MKVLDGNNKEIQLKNMDEDDDEVVNVDALAKYAEEHKTDDKKNEEENKSEATSTTTDDKTNRN